MDEAMKSGRERASSALAQMSGPELLTTYSTLSMTTMALSAAGDREGATVVIDRLRIAREELEKRLAVYESTRQS